MPRDQENLKAWRKQNYQKNKAKLTLKQKQYSERNKEKIKEYLANNKEKISLRAKEYRAKNPDKCRIRKWKEQGIIDGDFDLLNEVFKQQTHCWICLEEYSKTRIKCLEHDWSIKDDGNVRYICCHICNTKVVG